MQFLLVVVAALPALLFQADPNNGQTLRLPPSPDDIAYSKITAERNRDPKKKLMLSFVQNFSKSKHLAEVYIELSRSLVAESEFTSAQQYAEKAVSAVARLKAETAGSDQYDDAWRAWLKTLEGSANSNLTWVKQMADYQQQQIRSRMIPKK